jgi:hypothetical protein
MTRKTKELEDQEVPPAPEPLDAEQVTELPDRDEMSLVNLNAAAPINLALAANVLSDGAVAFANAQQVTPITQGT